MANRTLLGDALRSLGSVAQVAQKTTAAAAKHLAEDGSILIGHLRDVSGPLGAFKFNASYRLIGQQVSACGPCWKVFSASARSANAIHKDVSVWVLDKKALVESQRG